MSLSNPKYSTFRAAISAAFFVVGIGTSFAVSASTEIKELSAVTISASRSETRIEEMPQHTTVISREDIEKSPAQSLDQLLKTVPGLNFTGVPTSQSDPTGHSAKMRGMGNVKVLVLLDGVPIHDPFYLTIQWFKVPLTNIERIEVVRGGNSSLWGNMAAAGMINIISRRTKGNGGEVTASLGAFGTTNLALRKEISVSGTLGFSLTLDQFHTDGYQTTRAEDLWRYAGKGTTDAKNTNVQLTTYFQPASDLKGYVRIGYHVQDQEINYQFGRNLQSSPDIAASLTKEFDKGSNLTANAWAQEVKFEKYNGAACYWQAAGTKCPSTTAVTTTQVNGNIVQYYSQYGSQRYHERGGSVAYSKTLSGTFNSLQFGADYRNLWATDLEYFYVAPTALTNIQNFNASTYGKGEQTFRGVFAQTKFSPVEPLEITLSGRADSFRYSNRNNTRTSSAGVTTGGAIADSTKNAFSPSLAARYELSNYFSLRGAAYKAFRAPGFNNITRTFGTLTNTTIANPDLQPETLKGWELGTDYNDGRASLGATYFLYNIKDMIATYTVSASGTAIPTRVTDICGAVVAGSFSTCAATSVKYYTNDQDGQSHGVELIGSWKARHDLTLDATYTKTETYLTRRGSVVTDPLNVQLVAVPKDVISLGATYRPSDKLRVYGEVRYIGPILIDTTSVANTTFGQGGSSVVNASVSYAWDKATDLFASAINLFDKQYSENSYTYTQPYSRTLSQRQTISAGIKVKF